MRLIVCATLVSILGCDASGIPVATPCASLSTVPAAIGVQCSLQGDTGYATALATFDDGTQIIIVTEPAMHGVVLNPADEGVTFDIYPRVCPSWTGQLEINDAGDGFGFDLSCETSADQAIGYLHR